MQDRLNCTWSGSFIPASGACDAMTIELKHDDLGALVARVVSPISMTFPKAAFDTKIHSLLLERTHFVTGKQYKLRAKVEGTEIKGTEIKGTVTAGDEAARSISSSGHSFQASRVINESIGGI